MKLMPLLLAAGLLGQSANALAQDARRPIGGGGSFGGGGLIKPSAPKETITRTITYLALTKERQWLNTSGKSIFATLVAFDSGDKAKSIPPTIIKGGKIRLLKEKKVFLLPLDTLSPKHRSEVLSINSQVNGLYEKNPATKDPNPPPRPLSSDEMKRYATQLGTPPEITPAGCPAMLASIKNGEVTSIAQSKIKNWGPIGAHLWKGKPYWTVTVTYPDASGFGSLDTRAMALMRGTRVIKWLYSKSGEEVP